jgi:hypothetical protein
MPPKPYRSDDREERASWPRAAALLGAILLAAAGLAPVGLAALFIDVSSFHDLRGVGVLIGVFWTLLLLAAGFAAYTENKRRALAILFAILATALLNLAGCVAGLADAAKALG